MSPDDSGELPPGFHEQDTLPPPANDADAAPPPPDAETRPLQVHVIPRGFAVYAFHAAISDVFRALDMLVATGDAIARQLDEGDAP